MCVPPAASYAAEQCVFMLSVMHADGDPDPHRGLPPLRPSPLPGRGQQDGVTQTNLPPCSMEACPGPLVSITRRHGQPQPVALNPHAHTHTHTRMSRLAGKTEVHIMYTSEIKGAVRSFGRREDLFQQTNSQIKDKTEDIRNVGHSNVHKYTHKHTHVHRYVNKVHMQTST